MRVPTSVRSVLTILLSGLVSLGVRAQNNTTDQPPASKDSKPGAAKQPPAASEPLQSGNNPAPAAPDNASQQAPAAPLTPEQEREAILLADTARLLKLAQELKAEVDKSNKDTLSIAVIKKAAEVEELARSLKDRMKTEPAKGK